LPKVVGAFSLFTSAQALADEGVEAAANASVPSRETMNRSTNCMIVKETVETTIGPESFNM